MRIVIAEDNVLLAGGLELLLAAKGFEVCAVAGDAPGLLAAVDEHRPDVTIVDVRLPPSFRDEGIRAALEARRRHDGLPVLVLSQYVEREYAGELLSDGRGGIGYLLKDRVGRVAEFVDAVRRVAEGGTAMDPEVIPRRPRPPPRPSRPHLPRPPTSMTRRAAYSLAVGCAGAAGRADAGEQATLVTSWLGRDEGPAGVSGVDGPGPYPFRG
ncbi:response regulator transcription factor [Spirillospora sp. NPDC048911]|uniref:response regulator n=1 Tax=Spirillospora sp. NPDC048911 TaxID=3364527 RepID=UPI00371798F8